jgi:hypothetical protein
VVYAQLTGAIVQAALGAANMLFWRVLVDDGYALAGLALISCSFVFAGPHFSPPVQGCGPRSR